MHPCRHLKHHLKPFAGLSLDYVQEDCLSVTLTLTVSVTVIFTVIVVVIMPAPCRGQAFGMPPVEVLAPAHLVHTAVL